jgi:hypothetical protein
VPTVDQSHPASHATIRSSHSPSSIPAKHSDKTRYCSTHGTNPAGAVSIGPSPHRTAHRRPWERTETGNRPIFKQDSDVLDQRRPCHRDPLTTPLGEPHVGGRTVVTVTPDSTEHPQATLSTSYRRPEGTANPRVIGRKPVRLRRSGGVHRARASSRDRRPQWRGLVPARFRLRARLSRARRRTRADSSADLRYCSAMLNAQRSRRQSGGWYRREPWRRENRARTPTTYPG